MDHERAPPTRDLVQEAQAGNQDAFTCLVERHRSRLESLILFRLGPRLRQKVEMDDVYQETCLQAYQSLSQFQWRNDGSFFKWLGGIAEHVIQNLARHHFQTQKRNGAAEVSLSQKPSPGSGSSTGIEILPEANDISPSKAMRRNERFDRLERVLNGFRSDYREVIVLARVRGLPMKEIARRMDRSVDAVSMLLLRALRQLKEYFGSTDSLHLPGRRLDDDRETDASSNPSAEDETARNPPW